MTIKSLWLSITKFFVVVYHKIVDVVDGCIFWVNRQIQAIVDCRAYRVLSKWYLSLQMPGHHSLPVAYVLYNFVNDFKRGQVWQRSKGLAFSLMMAVPPLLLFLFSLIAYLPLDGVMDEFMIQLRTIIPENISERLDETIVDVLQHRHRSLQSIGFISSIILAAMGVHGLLQSMNYANNFVNRNRFVVRFGLCILIVFFLFLLLAVTFSLLIGYKHLITYLVLDNIIAPTKVTMYVFNFVRWVLMVFFTLLVLNIFYRFALGLKQRKYLRFLSLGSLLSTGLFFVLAWGFKIYLNNFANFNLLYGSIGTLLVTMVWIFANCYVLLVGYQLNGAIIKGVEHPEDWGRVQYQIRKNYWIKRYKRLRIDTHQSNVTRGSVCDKEGIMNSDTRKDKNLVVKVNLEVSLKCEHGQWKPIDTKILSKES